MFEISTFRFKIFTTIFVSWIVILCHFCHSLDILQDPHCKYKQHYYTYCLEGGCNSTHFLLRLANNHYSSGIIAASGMYPDKLMPDCALHVESRQGYNLIFALAKNSLPRGVTVEFWAGQDIGNGTQLGTIDSKTTVEGFNITSTSVETTVHLNMTGSDDLAAPDGSWLTLIYTEYTPVGAVTGNCSEGWSPCGGQWSEVCVAGHLVCDGVVNCPGGHDESQCPTPYSVLQSHSVLPDHTSLYTLPNTTVGCNY